MATKYILQRATEAGHLKQAWFDAKVFDDKARAEAALKFAKITGRSPQPIRLIEVLS